MKGFVPKLGVEGALCCPHCGRTYGVESGNDPETKLPSVYVQPDRDEYDSPAGTRGEYIRIDLWCSLCGAGFGLFVGNHKGMEILRVLLKGGEEWSGETKWEGPPDTVGMYLAPPAPEGEEKAS